MSRQINFYALPDDIYDFLEYISQIENIVLIIKVMKTKDLITIKSLHDYDLKSNYIGQIFLTKTELLSSVLIKKFNENHYAVDQLNSPIVEFSLPTYRHETKNYSLYNLEDTKGKEIELCTSRLYFDKIYLTADKQLAQHTDEFIDFGDRIFKLYFKYFKRKKIPESYSSYVTPRVEEWVRNGGKLSMNR